VSHAVSTISFYNKTHWDAGHMFFQCILLAMFKLLKSSFTRR